MLQILGPVDLYEGPHSRPYAKERFTNELSIFLGLVTPLVAHHTKTRRDEGMKENAGIILRGFVAWCEKKCSDEVLGKKIGG